MFQLERTLWLVSEGKLYRYQKKTYHSRYIRKVCPPVDLYRAGEKTAIQMLKAVARLHGLVMH